MAKVEPYDLIQEYINLKKVVEREGYDSQDVINDQAMKRAIGKMIDGKLGPFNVRNKEYLKLMVHFIYSLGESHGSSKLGEYVRKKYDESHKCCPKCGAEGHSTTLAGYILDLDNPDEYKDLNKCTCTECGDIHTAHERVPKK